MPKLIVIPARPAEVLPWNFPLKPRVEVAMKNAVKLLKFCCSSFLRKWSSKCPIIFTTNFTPFFIWRFCSCICPTSWRFSFCRRLSLIISEFLALREINQGLSLFKITKDCELFFPLEGPGSHRGGNPRKMGKNYKIPLPGPTPENGEKLQKNCKNCTFGGILPLFGAFFPIFGGRTGEGNFVIFPHFSGISAPVASRAV